MLVVGAAQVKVALPVVGVLAALTEMENAGSETLVLPSLTLITMFEWVYAAVGVPFRLPFAVLKVAQDGLFEILKPSVSPSASVAVGVKLYALPACTEVAGVPLMVGARFVTVVAFVAFVAFATVMVNAAREDFFLPSLALMTMSECWPAVVGVPLSNPVELEKVAHVGLLRMENHIRSPF